MDEIETVLLDFGGTLDLPGCHWLDRFLAYYRNAGWDLSRQELDLAYSCATARAYREGARMRSYGMRDLLRSLVTWQMAYLYQHLPEKAPKGSERGIDAIVEPFRAESAMGMARSREILVTLASRLKLGVVSNFYGNLDCILAEAEIAPLINVVIDSGREQLYKPDPALVARALSRLGAPAATSMMVGDSLDKDCAPAKAIGMKTAWLAGPQVSPDGRSNNLADYTIRDLAELLEICGGFHSRCNSGRRAG